MEMETMEMEKKSNGNGKKIYIIAPVLILVLQLFLQNDYVEQCWENEKLFSCDSVVGRENHLTKIFLADFDIHEKQGSFFEPAT